ncbi:MAG: hypothetical protein ABSH00_10170 [Bryobacteraceae bacterium]|jgi:hypothetical protein
MRCCKIPPSHTSFDLDGQSAGITAWGTIRATPAGRFNASLTADLGDLEQNITPLMRSELNRSARCGDRLSVDPRLAGPSGSRGGGLPYRPSDAT